jgi:hypothetical protein
VCRYEIHGKVNGISLCHLQSIQVTTQVPGPEIYNNYVDVGADTLINAYVTVKISELVEESERVPVRNHRTCFLKATMASARTR